ncbi:ABC transporter permease [Campylobacter insulaenigrae]|uniref:Lipid asymmetry ABC transporter MlaABCDEF, permease component MlaE n=1 Tax=Campylobacter insulaenigrae NCTC 12927 TaxID=1031564 RepID=A0A0A8H012_9BACT|nr:ABC transporter permease [Campylobacter insulaenigrae]AJC87120.1 lipid asymmetry ABC transporter MlaABCDEF, permease component MlaE [Campylobacter insulaenigrae NCTC 12927]VEH92799.1 ABC transporter permease [Campylobacter insulaenigrae]
MEIKTFINTKECVFSVFGSWDKDSITNAKIPDLPQNKNIVFDFLKLDFIDTIGVRYFLALENELKQKGYEIARINLSNQHNILFTLCEKYYKTLDDSQGKRCKIKDFFENLGKKIFISFEILIQFLNFIGLIIVTCFQTLFSLKKLRFKAFLYHVENSAINALPIVMLTSLLVGIVLAYQAAYQLVQFGANIYIVDLMGISATRELAPLISAIVIAGRSASSYTAQIGVMKLTDEIDAMKTMGFKESEFIILPRVLALSLAMPFVVIVADILSISGGVVVAWVSLEITASEFMNRFKEAVELKHIIIGLIKAPMFGFLIASIACFRGFFVQKTTESIGVYTTKSVVNAIFWVIAFDAIFSVFLTKAGI